MNRQLVGACGVLAAMSLLALAGCESGPKSGPPLLVGIPVAPIKKPYLSAARTLDNYHENFAAKAVAMHLTHTIGVANFGSYWIMFDGENAQDSNSISYNVESNDPAADFTLMDGSAYVKIDGFPKPPFLMIWPIIVTQHIVIGAEGTEFIVQNDVKPATGEDPHSTQRVFLIDTPAKPLKVRYGFQEVALTNADTYAEYHNGVLSGPLSLPIGSGPLRTYVNGVVAKATNFCK